MQERDVVIIGGGISGLSALHFLKGKKPDITIELLESKSRLGGTIGTDNINGYSFDWGPNGFLDREPLTLQLCDELGLTDQIQRANNKVTNRFILRAGKLRSVPMTPPAFMKSSILPWSGKFRLMMEPLIKAKRKSDDESIYDFGCRRIGRSAADYMIQPMVSGIYGGMAHKLSLKACFPIMREMEDEYGSLFKAMMAKAKAAKKAGKKSGGPGGPGGWLTSFKGGLNQLIDQCDKLYGENISLDSPVDSIKKTDDGFIVHIGDERQLFAKKIVLAAPSNHSADMTQSLSPALSDSLGKIEYAPIIVVCLGYDLQQVNHDLDGFGFLVPSKEKLRILGSIWTSSIFEGRAPDGKVQFRSMLGGDGDHDAINLSDSEIVETVAKELDKIIGLKGKPEQVRIFRFGQGIPQFKIGHAEKVEAIESELNAIGNIKITGNAYYGIGLNDCVKQSYKIASELTA